MLTAQPLPHRSRTDDDRLDRDLRTLVRFIEVYCLGRHGAAQRAPVLLKTHDVSALHGGQDVHLCPECTKLLAHALVKRTLCRMDPKPQCKHCPKHCYAPVYRREIRDVMRFSGRHLVLRGRLDYLVHLLF